MRPFAERSDNTPDQPDANVHSTIRMTVQEAAAALGITVEAVRGRMHRGKYGREKSEDGRVLVVLSPDQLPNSRERSQATGPNVQSESYERLVDQSAHFSERLVEREDLVEELRDWISYLERLLDQEREARTEERRRHDTLLATLMQRIPELETATEQRGSPDTASQDLGNGDSEEDQEKPAKHRSWLYRFFFGP